MSQYEPIKMDKAEMMCSLHRALEDAKEIITDLKRTDNIPKGKEGFFQVLKASVEYGAEEVEKCMREGGVNKPITREEIEKGITTYVEGKYDPIYIGYNSHDCEAMYKCPQCGEVHGDWEWFGKREFTCTCGATWNVPE